MTSKTKKAARIAPMAAVSQAAPDELVPDPEVFKEFGVCAMTVWRWDHDPAMAELGWPPPIYIRKRKYRPRQKLESFKRRMLEQAVRERARRHADRGDDAQA
jgi:hypothetical protein